MTSAASTKCMIRLNDDCYSNEVLHHIIQSNKESDFLQIKRGRYIVNSLYTSNVKRKDLMYVQFYFKIVASHIYYVFLAIENCLL